MAASSEAELRLVTVGARFWPFEARFSLGKIRKKFCGNCCLPGIKHGHVEDPLTVPEAAKRLAIGVSTLRRYMRQRLLSYIVYPGNDYRIEPQEVEEFKKSRTVPRRERQR